MGHPAGISRLCGPEVEDLRQSREQIVGINLSPECHAFPIKCHYLASAQRNRHAVAANLVMLAVIKGSDQITVEFLRATAMMPIFHHLLVFAIVVAWAIQLGHFAYIVIQWRSSRAE
jgi:hypothetical protein